MSTKAPKFLDAGIRLDKAFFGSGTLKTMGMSVAEVGIKAAPIFAFIYGMSKYLKKLML